MIKLVFTIKNRPTVYHWACFLFLILLQSTACKEKNVIIPPVPEAATGVFVCNEGNFTFGNASLSFIDPQQESITNDAFFNTNGFPIGDVLQSITLFENHAFLMVSNSDKVQVIDATNFTHQATITGLNSPRYMQVINDNKAYISSLWSTIVTIVNPHTFEKIGLIDAHHPTDMFVKLGKYVFTNSWVNSTSLLVIDSEADTIVKTIAVPFQPNSLVMDQNNHLWVLSDGGIYGTSSCVNAALTCIDINTFEILKTLSFPNIKSAPSRLCINKQGTEILFLNGSWETASLALSGIFKMSIETTELPTTPFIAEEENQLFYGLSIDPSNNDIYISNTIDYTQSGIISQYSYEGALLGAFTAGIAPGTFTFKQ